MGWSGGIRPTLRSLATSVVGEAHSFEVCGQDELSGRVASWHPDLLAWHGAASWRSLPRFLRRFRGRQILFEHHYCLGFERCTVPSRRRFHAMLRLAYGCMNRVVAVSEGQRRWIQDAALVAPSRLRLLLSSRPLDPFLTLPPPPLGAPSAEAPLRLLAYGRLTPQKGFDLLIRALALLPAAPVRLQLAGDGPQRQELEALARSDSRIRLLGARQDIPELLADCDAVVIPSRWEPWGNVCLEARAAGRPVLVSPVDGLPEQVDGCGLLAGAVTEQALAAALQRLLGSGIEQRQRWSERGRQSAGGSWPAYLEGWQQLLGEWA
jgi:glycosyltransferase involved in cell wall biosynthesis